MKKEIIKTIIIVILAVIISFYFINQWFNGRLLQARNTTLIQIQNEIYDVIKTKGQVNINYYEIDDKGEVKVVDNIILIEQIVENE